MRTMRTGIALTILALAGQAMSAQAQAQAQAAGRTIISDNGGSTKPGCVTWSYTVQADGSKRDPDKVRLVFSFKSACTKTVHLRFWTQDAQTDAATPSTTMEIAPGATVTGNAKSRMNLIYVPRTYKYLNFWIFQSDQRFNFKAGNMPDMRRCNPDFKPQPGERVPACPPLNKY